MGYLALCRVQQNNFSAAPHCASDVVARVASERFYVQSGQVHWLGSMYVRPQLATLTMVIMRSGPLSEILILSGSPSGAGH